jgi:hypothetical protein
VIVIQNQGKWREERNMRTNLAAYTFPNTCTSFLAILLISLTLKLVCCRYDYITADTKLITLHKHTRHCLGREITLPRISLNSAHGCRSYRDLALHSVRQTFVVR